MKLLSILPIMPLYYSGKTKFTPIHVSDLTNIIFEVVQKKITGTTIECIGPEVITFKEIILKKKAGFEVSNHEDLAKKITITINNKKEPIKRYKNKIPKL